MNDIVMSREKFNADLEKAQKIAINKTLEIVDTYVYKHQLGTIKQQVYKELFAEQIE